MPNYFQVAGCAIIEKQGRVLLTRRTKGRWRGGTWEFVSGRVEQGENLPAGLKREVEEETSLKVEPLFPIHVVRFYRGKKLPENEIFMVTYVCRWVSGRVNLKTDEQDKFEWVDLKKTDLSKYPGLEVFDEEIKAYLGLKR